MGSIVVVVAIAAAVLISFTGVDEKIQGTAVGDTYKTVAVGDEFEIVIFDLQASHDSNYLQVTGSRFERGWGIGVTLYNTFKAMKSTGGQSTAITQKGMFGGDVVTRVTITDKQ